MNKQKFRGLDFFSPACFPVGTVVEINDDVRHKTYHEDGTSTMDSPIMTVTGVVRNGYKSYIFTTDEKIIISDTESIDRSMNLHHVKRIIKRGDGPMLIDHGWYGVRKNGLTHEHIDRMRVTGMEPKERKGYHSTLSIRDVVYWELSLVANPGDLFDLEEFVSAVCGQTWCQLKGQGFFRFHVINKKRLRAFVRANRNHFLTDLKKAEAEYEAEMARIYNEDFEREYARERKKFYVAVGDIVKVQVYDGDLEVESVDPEDDMVTCVGTTDREVRVVVHASGIEIVSRLSAYDAGYDYGEMFFGDDDEDDIVEPEEDEGVVEPEEEETAPYVEPADPFDLV